MKSRWHNSLIVLLVVLLVSSVTMTGCGRTDDPTPSPSPDPDDSDPPDQPAGPQPGGTLIIAMEADPDTLDPHKTGTIFETQIVQQMMEALIDIDFDGEPQLLLAEDYDILEEGLVWRFYLRQGVKFHDGTELTAEDVKYSLERAVDPETGYAQRARVDMVERAEVVDDHTVDIYLKYPSAPLFDGLSIVPIAPKALLSADAAAFAREPVGTGPFQFKNWAIGDEVVLERNEDYWAGYPNLDEVVFRAIPEASVRIMELESGNVDVVFEVPPRDLERLQGLSNITVTSTPGSAYRTMALNNLAEPLNNVKVRQAISWAINREAIVEAVWPGIAQAARGPIPPNSWAFSEDVPYYSYDPDKARELLVEAGYPDGFEIDYIIATREGEDREAVLIQEQLGQVGIDVTITPLEWTVLVGRLFEGDYEMLRVGITQTPEPDTLTYQWYHSSAIGALNFLHFSDDALDQVLDEARTTMDQDERRLLYSQVEEMLFEHAPTVFLYYELRTAAFSDQVEGINAHTSLLVKLCAPTWGVNVSKK